MSSLAVRFVASKPKAKKPLESSWRAVHRAADGQQKKVARAVKQAATIGQRALDYGVFANTLMNRGTDPRAADRAAEYATGLMTSALEPRLAEALRGSLGAAGGAEYMLTARALRIAAKAEAPTRGVFNILNPEAVIWIRTHGGDAIKGIMERTRLAIRKALDESFRRGITTGQTARMIRRMIGLDEDRADALWSLRDKILDSPGLKVWAGDTPIRVPDNGFSDEELAVRLDRYAAKLLNDRAKNIARTETIAAANEGQRQAWMQAVRDRLLDATRVERVWIKTNDEKTCPICLNLDGTTAPIGGQFQSPDIGPLTGPPAHPQCRCAQGIQKKEARAATSGQHKWGTTQILLPAREREEVLVAARAILDDWLAEQGREDRPHVTILYGLDNAMGVEQAVRGFGPVEFMLDETDAFEGVEEGTADALIIRAVGGDLDRLREKLLPLAVKEQLNDYQPHVTIAYVKLGMGKELAQKFQGWMRGRSVMATSLEYSGRLGEKRRFQLVNQRAAGGPGSGDFGHSGRPGEVGGSGSGGNQEFSPQQKSALEAYSNEGYRQINAELRGHSADLMSSEDLLPKESVQEEIALIDEAFAKTKTTEDKVLYRSVATADLPGVVGHHALIGKSFVDQGYSSTSTEVSKAVVADPDLARNSVQMEVRLPKGSQAIWMDKISGHKESEVLLPRGTKFKIVSTQTGEFDPKSDRIVGTKVVVEAKTPKGKHRVAGGPGSGDFGHSGRPGEVGGSGSGGGGKMRQSEPRVIFKEAEKLQSAMVQKTNERDVDELTEISTEARAAMKASIVDNLTNRGVDKVQVQRTIDMWAMSSGDTQPGAVARQDVIRREFDISPESMNHLDNTKPLEGDLLEESQTYVRAEYAATQDWLKASGIENVSVYRGVEGMSGLSDTDIQKAGETGLVTTVMMAPASSWSVSLDVAQTFAADGFVLQTRVPRERVLSTAVTGRGCLNEGEILLLGGSTQVLVHSNRAQYSEQDEGTQAP